MPSQPETTQSPVEKPTQPTKPVQPPKPKFTPFKRPLDLKQRKYMNIGIGVLVVLAGVVTGWLITGRSSLGLGTRGTSISKEDETGEVVEAGLSDEETFRDSAEGELMEGGIDGEGTHHLDRGLGPEKYVYLTSTVVDMQGFVGKKVKIWGETISAKEAGWLMDVGKIKVIK